MFYTVVVVEVNEGKRHLNIVHTVGRNIKKKGSFLTSL
jgi:hypothetical protein